MQRELIDEASFKKIISNQNLIVQDLDKSYTSMLSFLQLSTKYLPEAMNSFKIGQQHITNIRANLDYIHKVMMKIKKKIKIQKQEEKLKSQQINTITQAMQNVMQEQSKDNFLQTGNGQNEEQIEKSNKDSLSNKLQTDQIQKLMAYYKLDQNQNEQKQQTDKQQKQEKKENDQTSPGPFVLLSKQANQNQQKMQNKQQVTHELLI